jgi:hypothetical protein
MNPDEVKALAESLLTANDNGKWRYEIGAPERDKKHPQEWNVVIRWSYPDGTPLDGPGIVIVDEATGEARFL